MDEVPTEAVLRVLDEHDPEGLREMGAPADEYMPEAEHLARLASENRMITAELVTSVWRHWFSPASSFLANASRQDVEQLAAHLEAEASAARAPQPREPEDGTE